MRKPQALLILPRLRIQNANAISSSMTWGFPAMSAFVGAMHALERKLPDSVDLLFNSVGVICHGLDAQVTTGGFTKSFLLTRNPVGKDGNTAPIIEEGRAHIEVTLVLGVEGKACDGDWHSRDAVASEVAHIVAGMRIAGGSVMPALPGQRASRQRPKLISLADDASEREEQFKRLRRSWLPGFALVSRDDLLAQRVAELQASNPDATELDAWLDCSRLNIHCVEQQPEKSDVAQTDPAFSWQVRKLPGWIVPIPIGYGALSECYKPGAVLNARDTTTPFRFVESLYSLGQWISPHRLGSPTDLLWYPSNDLEAGLYRLHNDYQSPVNG
ncbi:MAG: type I-F CRISPR-associated protein Csy2 [Gammaproteobacteria bacterium]|nr:type I-F CRISPR-associated protein Csy2 [Gammaproteobacteria bacterium]MBQ0774405.1 type I-F CRISPR-associated protein Csy2 [Gammaproteobacteria bacterium]